MIGVMVGIMSACFIIEMFIAHESFEHILMGEPLRATPGDAEASERLRVQFRGCPVPSRDITCAMTCCPGLVQVS